MKAIIVSIILCGISSAVYGDEVLEKESGGRLISVGGMIIDISGTKLSVSNIHSKDLDGKWTRHACEIGYKQRSGIPFVTLIKLPDLENDSYLVTFENGMLTVTTKKGNSLVMALNLEKMAPDMITGNSAEQTTPSNGDKPAK